MLRQIARAAPFLLTGALLLNLLNAVLDGGRGNWLMVGLVALALALTLWWHGHKVP